MKYHNESNIVLGEKAHEEEREKKRVEEEKLKKQ